MGHVVKTPAGTYRANWRDPTNRQKAKTFRTRKEASAFLADAESTVSRGTYVDPAAGRITFRDHAERWVAARVVEATTSAATGSRLRARLLPYWGRWPLSTIDHLAVQTWVAGLAKDLAPATVASCFANFSAIMAFAVRSRLIPYSPCEGVRLPPRRKLADDGIMITREELIGRLLPVVSERYRALVACAAGAGLRWGECLGLRWETVDLSAGTLRVVRVVVEVSGHVAVKPCPKSAAGRRVVPLAPFLAVALAEHRQVVSGGPHDPVFTALGGGPVLRGNFRRRVWLPALAASGLPARLRFHDLRHCYATWLVSEGVPVNVVQRVMGHEQASTTLNRYTHAPTDFYDQVRRALGGLADDPLTMEIGEPSGSVAEPSEEGS